jgi:hypothetical protein
MIHSKFSLFIVITFKINILIGKQEDKADLCVLGTVTKNKADKGVAVERHMNAAESLSRLLFQRRIAWLTYIYDVYFEIL